MERRNKAHWLSHIEEKVLDATRERRNVNPQEKERREIGALRVVRSAGRIGGLTSDEITRAINRGAESAKRRKVIDDK